MRTVVITGVGVVSSAGIGREALASALTGTPVAPGGFRVPDFRLEEYVANARSFRRVADATKFLLAAISLALADAGLVGDQENMSSTGLVVGLTHGAIDYSTRFHLGLLQEGPSGASPLHFAESVLNAPAGNSAIAFGIRGPVHTLIGEETVGAQAISLARSLLCSGALDRCIVAGAEEWTEIIVNAYGQADRARNMRGKAMDTPTPLGEGAAALVLETGNAARRRGAALRGAIGAVSLRRCLPETMTGEVVNAIRGTIQKAGLQKEEIGHIVLPTGRSRAAVKSGAAAVFGESGSAVHWIDIAQHVGNPFGAAGLLQAAASAALISSERVRGAGLVLSSGIERTLSTLVVAPEQR
jgi:3-oxoacyl-[acyl-carrier-protein] synthase II